MVVQLVGWVAAVCSRVPVQVAAAEVVPKVLEVVAVLAAAAKRAVGGEYCLAEGRVGVGRAVAKLVVGWGWESAVEVDLVRGWVYT